ncbi:hypothetical protein CROQUDRAFT_100484 [Cronartium quercuum f. sp. fusiforme G11]|uniref:Uncharacterized protein n=1 Tax=Cronartium quercuum f. sp. fusiforme G11 TaxID=708437 RepID=A0A9P6N9L9_9BASI|nr:hypothetical protein CROQUDRAFT_100484 [Cronartium quercuum f. sp. fusiforme G11]
MLSPIEAHSDDEQCSKLNSYIVKTPIFCSIKAGIFMHRLNDHMFKSAQLNGRGQSKLHRCLRPKKPIESTFTKPPTGLLIDFYNADWFNNTLSMSQICDIADIDNVMFLPNPELSLLGKTHPDETLKDSSFTRKHWSKGSKDYNLDFLTTPEDEEGEDGDGTDEDNDSYYAGSIDLEDMDGEDNENEDSYGKEMGEENNDQDEDGGEGCLEPFDEDMNDDWENARIEDNNEGFEETHLGKGEHFIVDQDMYDDGDEA